MTFLDPEFAQQLEDALPSRPEGRSRGRRITRNELSWRLTRRGENRRVPRLERLFLRLLGQERATVQILIDASAWMTFAGYTPPQPSQKFDFARRLAATLSYALLLRDFAVQVNAFAPARAARAPQIRSRDDAPQLLTYLDQLQAGGNRNFAWALRKLVLRASPETIFLVLSDFRDRFWECGEPALLMNHRRVVLLHLMDRSELAPPTSTEPTPAAEEELRQHLAEIARRYHLEYIPVTTDTPFEEMLLRALGENTLPGTG